MNSSEVLWSPSTQRSASSHLTRFIGQINSRFGLSIEDALSLYQWSIEHSSDFWSELVVFSGVQFRRAADQVWQRSSDTSRIPRGRWFPGAQMNMAENLLRFRDDRSALIFWGEDRVRCSVTYSELSERVAKLSAQLKEWGVGVGDRVAGMMPNIPDTVIAMLATNSVGAIWASCSPDFGVPGVLDRFGQIAPKVLFAADGYFFKGSVIDCTEKIAQIRAGLPTLEQLVISAYTKVSTAKIPRCTSFEEILGRPEVAIEFTSVPFDHPAYIMFSSGTTGKPKCIVHSAGGVLLELQKEHLLHTDISRDDVVFYQTTCGWMMWNWLVHVLGCGATIVLYDGAPFHRNAQILFDLADHAKITVFGTNAKYLAACQKEGVSLRHSHSLSSLKTILSTGSPLAPESFDYVYREIKSDICLSSISGGTDILGCFALGSPTLPVRRGELQMRSLGLGVEVFDVAGRPLRNKMGELVCTNPFPSMPVGLWGDQNHERYYATYFARFPGVWHHGDFVELRDSGGMIFSGRSDAVLNPGGVRIGTAEIYRQVESIPEVLESVAIAQEWQKDVRVVLFVRLRDGIVLDDELRKRIAAIIRSNASPFHVPKKILQVYDIPRTRSGKIVELAIREIVHGRPIENREALANPEALIEFSNRPELISE